MGYAGQTKAEYLRRRRALKRRALLDALAPGRCCGRCGKSKRRSRQLVVMTEARGRALFGVPVRVACRSCVWSEVRRLRSGK